MLNPFDAITKPIELLTKTSSRACDLLFLSFVLIPVCYYFGGPRFTLESLNCACGVFWFLAPFLIFVFGFLSFSWWRFASSLAFSTAWIPVCIMSFVVWMPLLEGVEKNSYPFAERLETRRASNYTDDCRYRISLRVLGPVGDRRTLETRLVPGLKWIKITDQHIDSIAAIQSKLQ